MIKDRGAIERRWDGPIPFWEEDGPGPEVEIRRRMRVHRRLALEFAAAARRCGQPADVARLRANVAGERRAHSQLARLLNHTGGHNVCPMPNAGSPVSSGR